MAYEAYTNTVQGIANKAYAEWRQGNETQPVIERMAREANVEEWHCNKQLTKLIIDNHYDAILSRAKGE
jgi:hypothetical protein